MLTPLGRLPRIVLLFLALMLSGLGAQSARARELRIQNFDVSIEVQPDATCIVTEIIQAKFTGEWHGLYRTIPVQYTTQRGFGYTLFLDLLSITGDSGDPLKYEVSTQRGYKKFKIYVPGAVNATRTVTLRYRVEDGLRFFDDHDELYWNITGNEWDVPIDHATARIVLPQGVTGVRTLVFTGAYGSREQDADVDVTGNIIQIHMRRRLDFHEGLTAVIGWGKGFVHEPGWPQHALLFLRSNWPLVIPILVFFFMLWMWSTRGRDPRLRPIAVQYEPPQGLSPGEVGTLADNRADMRDITATIVDLAVRGYLTIEQTETDQMLGLVHHRSYSFHLKKPSGEWDSLKPHEQTLLSALFDGGSSDSVTLMELQNHFYTHLPTIRNRIFDGLMDSKYYLHRPDKVRNSYIGGGVVAGILLVWLGGAASGALNISPLTGVISGISTGLIIAAFGLVMPARTDAGARALEGVLGFETFLSRVEEPRFERVVKTPEMFEKFLPFAMALGVEKKWVRAFANIYLQPPSWYSGPYGAGFQPIYFVNDLGMMSHQAGSAMASAPRGSGGSGFGGGGGSGGGFGGGGGGGF
ncbi:MAG: DUF2207 domain-containing protein [Candidatus Acidiferrales bacterium]